YCGLVTVLAVIPLAFGLLALSGRPLRRLTRGCAWLLLRLTLRRMSVEGLESLPARGPVLLASNHTSYLDVVALCALLPIDFVFVAKQEVATWPLIGRPARR